MDVFVHSLVGYSATNDLAGIVGSIIPDLPMIKRQPRPSEIYLFTHSLAFCALCALLDKSLALGVGWHIVIDCITHGRTFQPRLFYPFSDRILFPQCREWEFFNLVWWRGLVLSCIIAILIGSR